jgi:hypothetical protein
VLPAALGRHAVTGANALIGLLPETRSPAARLLDKQGISPAQAADVVARRHRTLSTHHHLD